MNRLLTASYSAGTMKQFGYYCFIHAFSYIIVLPEWKVNAKSILVGMNH
ncbi:hypothetical protein LRP49_13525 [Enterovibrio sp. ZSDZ35]|uniref:Uncharacterized protein n=1 Tax=Enterovibrio qingdaonensis TaxID=2899818 RepID=A0ABT5QNC9_9GAMM|nr:hypothetical protein [Enterovibrio sp. ZSDZ35]MDD1782193.1 hypothetical protein [Enterovibrio sp. ZSDZ35]